MRDGTARKRLDCQGREPGKGAQEAGYTVLEALAGEDGVQAEVSDGVEPILLRG